MVYNGDRSIRFFAILLFIFLICFFCLSFHSKNLVYGQLLGALPLQGIYIPLVGGFFGLPATSFGLPFQNSGLGFISLGPYGYAPQTQGINLVTPTPFANFYSPFNYTSQFEGNIFSTYTPVLNIESNPFTVGSTNPYSPLYGISNGNLPSLQSTFVQQAIFNGSIQGYNPWGQNQQWNSINPWQIWGYGNINTNNSSTDTGDSGNDNEGDNINTDDTLDVRGYWAGTWEAFETDPNGIITDPNGGAVIAKTGELKLHITQQTMPGGTISGTIEITNWDVEKHANWDGESDEIELTGWVDTFNQYFKARYIYKEGDNEYHYILVLGSNLSLAITSSRISGSFSISSQDYYIIGTFSLGSFQP